MKLVVRIMLLITVILFLFSIFYSDQKSIFISGINTATFFILSLIWNE